MMIIGTVVFILIFCWIIGWYLEKIENDDDE